MTYDENFVKDRQQQIEGIYRQLGERYYAAHRDEVPEEFADLFREIQSHEAAIESYEAEQHRAKELEEKGLILCPFCGEEIVNRSVFCNFCGKRLSDYAKTKEPAPEKAEESAAEEPAAEAPAIEEPVVEEPAAEPAVCSKCGAVLEEGCAFCMDCGTPVAKTAQTAAPAKEKTDAVRTCPKCGFKTTDPEAVFCNNCGTRLSGDGAPAEKSAPQEKHCPFCGFRTTDKDVMFCIECGSRLV